MALRYSRLALMLIDGSPNCYVFHDTVKKILRPFAPRVAAMTQYPVQTRAIILREWSFRGAAFVA